MDLVGLVIREGPLGLVLLGGLGAAAWSFGRSKVVGGLLAAGVVLMGLDVLLVLVCQPAIGFAASSGMLGIDMLQLASLVFRVCSALLYGAGVVACAIAVAAGPAPARSVEEEP